MLLRYVYTALTVTSKGVSRDLPNDMQKRKKGRQIPCNGTYLPFFASGWTRGESNSRPNKQGTWFLHA